MLEYPPSQLAWSSKKSKKALQTVQNKALRFIYNTKWHDFITNQELHRRANIMSIDERLNKLKDKAIQHLNAHFIEDINMPTYKYSDFTIESEPFNNKPRDVRKNLSNFNSGLFTQ